MEMTLMTTNHEHDVPFTTSVRAHWRFIVVEGVILILLGLLAVLIPPIGTWAVDIFLGWLFVVSGLIGLISTLVGRHAPGFWWALLSAVLAIGVGCILIAVPRSGALALIYVLIAFFIIEGVATIMFALEHKRQLSGRWEWMVFSGVIDLVLAAVVVSGLPGTAVWAVGLLVGINMVVGGSVLIVMALYAHVSDPRLRQVA
jgi:uncharacterized membrane protein HdeD (DUF308 family)